MLIALAAWVGGGVAWAAGFLLLRQILREKYEHREWMAEHAVKSARQAEEIEQSRAERFSRTRPDLADLTRAVNGAEPAGDDAPTEVIARAEIAAAEAAAELPSAEPAPEPAGSVWFEDDPLAPTVWPPEADAAMEAADAAGEGARHRLPTNL